MGAEGPFPGAHPACHAACTRKAVPWAQGPLTTSPQEPLAPAHSSSLGLPQQDGANNIPGAQKPAGFQEEGKAYLLPSV